MRKNYLKNRESSSLHDIVFLMAAGFFVLFMVAFFYVNPVAKLGKINKLAEFIITVSWPNDIDVDVDTWVIDPNDILTWYEAKSPNDSLVYLERDDLGTSNDTIVVNGEKVVIKQNEELVTIRGIHPGKYVLNIHYFSSRKYGSGSIPVMVSLTKLNPTVKLIFSTKDPIILTRVGQEVTVIRFEVDLDGSVINISTGPPISLIEQRPPGTYDGSDGYGGGDPY